LCYISFGEEAGKEMKEARRELFSGFEWSCHPLLSAFRKGRKQ